MDVFQESSHTHVYVRYIVVRSTVSHHYPSRMCEVTVLVMSVSQSVSQCVSYPAMATSNGHNSKTASSIATK